ncbi:hypothetical protein [Metabacillus idriensis]|uniref:hypothetical protein n=1 Tax=Metabacillus idriensis TaxID=324768 RepID=UPI00174AE059|nr:hypothetical protein [Metabacillus idriensis]
MIIEKNIQTYKTSVSQIFIVILMLMICFRIIIDLTGYLGEESGNLNFGAIYSVLFLCISFLLVVHKWVNKGVSISDVLIFSIIIGYIIAFIYNGIFPGSSTSLFRFLTGFIAFNLLFYSDLKGKSIKYIKLFFILLLVPIIISWLQYIGLYPFTFYDWVNGSEFGRPSGGYFQPSSLTRLLIFGCILIYIIDYSTKFKVHYKLSLLSLLLATCFISGHRTSLLIMLILILFYELHQIKKFLGFLLKSLPLIIPIILLATFLLREKIESYLIIYSELLNISNNGNLEVRGRGEIWGNAADILSNEYDPIQLIFGYGYPIIEAHNDILRIILVNGIWGLFLNIFLLIFVYKFVSKKVNKPGRIILNGTYIYLFLFSIPLHPTEYPNFLWLFTFTLIILINIFRKS